MLDIADQLPVEEKANLSGVILAGEKSRCADGFHMGLLSFQDEKLVHRQIRCLKQLCAEIILVTNEPRTFLPLVDCSVRIITEFYVDKGPLGGMHAAFSLAQYPDVWLVGCDMPIISYQAAKLMLDKKRKMDIDAVIPYIDDKLYPLHGIYDRRCAKVIRVMMDNEQYRVESFLDLIRYERIMT